RSMLACSARAASGSSARATTASSGRRVMARLLLGAVGSVDDQVEGREVLVALQPDGGADGLQPQQVAARPVDCETQLAVGDVLRLEMHGEGALGGDVPVQLGHGLLAGLLLLDGEEMDQDVLVRLLRVGAAQGPLDGYALARLHLQERARLRRGAECG